MLPPSRFNNAGVQTLSFWAWENKHHCVQVLPEHFSLTLILEHSTSQHPSGKRQNNQRGGLDVCVNAWHGHMHALTARRGVGDWWICYIKRMRCVDRRAASVFSDQAAYFCQSGLLSHKNWDYAFTACHTQVSSDLRQWVLSLSATHKQESSSKRSQTYSFSNAITLWFVALVCCQLRGS